MANVNIKFNNKEYLLSCDDGQEESLKKLTKFLDRKYFANWTGFWTSAPSRLSEIPHPSENVHLLQNFREHQRHRNRAVPEHPAHPRPGRCSKARKASRPPRGTGKANEGRPRSSPSTRRHSRRRSQSARHPPDGGTLRRRALTRRPPRTIGRPCPLWSARCTSAGRGAAASRSRGRVR